MFVVCPDVTELVGECLHGLRVVHVVADADDSPLVVGVAVGPAAVTALELEPVLRHQRGELLPQTIGCLAAQKLGRFGNGRPVRLADVEDVHDAEASKHACGVAGLGTVGLLGLV